MSKTLPRLLEVSVAPYGIEFEWKLLEREDMLMSGLCKSRAEAQKEGNSALFEVLSSGWYPDSSLA
jgi:hypothetical protein